MTQSIDNRADSFNLLPDNDFDASDSVDFKEPLPEDIITRMSSLPSHSSNLQAFFTLFKSFIGCAVFTLPFSFRRAGLALSGIITLLAGLLALYSLLLILEVANSVRGRGKTTIERLTYDVLGHKVMRSVEISLIIMQVGVCIGIFILGGHFLDYSLCVYNVRGLCRNNTFKVLLFAILTMPISFINNAHYFYIPSLIGTIFVITSIGSQLVYDLQLISHMPNFGDQLANGMEKFEMGQIAMVFGVATYGFEGIGTLFSIRNAMEKPQDFPKLVKIELWTLISLLVGFSIVSAVALGDALPEIVLFSLPKDNMFFLFIQIGIVISNLMSYPLQFYPAMMIIESTKLVGDEIFDEKGKTKNYILRYGLRMFFIGLMILIANVAKSFNLFLNFLGSCVFVYVGYVIPICVYNTHFKDISKAKRVFNWSVMVISIILGAIGAAKALVELFGYKEVHY